MKLHHMWLLLVFWCCCWAGPAYSAPHILGTRPEPATAKVGSFRTAQLNSPRLALALPHLPPRTLNLLLLRVDFVADTNADTTGTGEWSDPTYAHNNDSDYWVNKNRDDLIRYYGEVSRGSLTLTADISSQVYRLPQEMAYYGADSVVSIENLIVDAVTAARTAGQSFTGYDAILIVHAGGGEETDINNDTPGDIWSLYYADYVDSVISTDNSSINPPLQIDGVNLTEAILMPQTGTQDGTSIDPLGIYAHEFGHFLGLPDLYPTNFISIWAGVSSWCLMGDGLYNRADSEQLWGSAPAWPSAWCRLYLGWEDPPLEQPLADPDLGPLTFQAVTAVVSPPGLRLLKVKVSPDATTNYFLIENRQQSGFDTGLEGHGLLVWRIDDAVIDRNIASNTVNNRPFHPGVALLEADGDFSLLSTDGFADAGDPFPGTHAISSLTPTTSPTSTSTSSGPGWLNMRAIAEIDGTVTCTVGLGPAVVQNIAATIDRGTVELDWNAVAASVAYKAYRNGILLETTTDTYFAHHNAVETDYYAIASIDAAGNETLSSPQITPEPVAASFGGGGGKCFIATAAYGSYEAPTVKTLRLFRDRILLTNPPGRLFVKIYYTISPPLAALIADSPVLRAGVRIVLFPVIAVAAFCVVLTAVQQIVVLLLVVSLLFLSRLLLNKPGRSRIDMTRRKA